MAELTAYDKKRQEEYKKFLADLKKNRNKPAQVSDAQRRRARNILDSSMYYRRPDLQQSLANAQEANRAKKEANKKESNQLRDIINRTETPSIQNMTVEQLQALRRENEDEQLATLYRTNPNFATDTPPARGTRAREIWDRENQRRLDEKQRKIGKDYENQADYLLAVPDNKTASANPRTGLRTERFDPDAITPQGQVLAFEQRSPDLRPSEDDTAEKGMSGKTLADAERVSDFRRRFSKDTQQAYDVEKIKRDDGPAFMEMMKQDRDNIRSLEEYDESMAGEEGFPETTVNYPGTKKAQIEQINIDTKEIAEQLDEEGITDPEERKVIKEQVGNYFRDTSTNQLINLDRLQAEMDTIEKRKELFATAQLLSGKARQNYMIRNRLVDEDDIPEPTEAEKLEKTLKLNETKFKLAELVKKTADLNKPEAKKFTEEQQAYIDIGKQYLKDDDVDNAMAAFEAAGVKMPKFKVNDEQAAEALISVGGQQLDMSKYGVVTKDGIKDFFKDYRKSKKDLAKEMSQFKYASVDGFTIEKKTKAIPYFKNAGVPMWEELQKLAGTEGVVNDFSFIQDNSLRNRMEAIAPIGGFSNETEYISAVSDIVFDRELDRITGRFHSKYKSLTEEGSLLSQDFGKDTDTGGEGARSVEEIPEGDFDSAMGDETDLAVGEGEGLLKKALARKDENVESRSNVYGNKEFFEDLGIGTNRGGGNPKRARARNLNVENIAEDSENQTVSGLQAAELAQPISDMILNDPLNEQFTFGDFTDGRRGVENLQAFDRTQRFEGEFTPKIRQEFFEKKKGERKKPVMANGKPVYHIGYGIRLPLNKKEVQVLRSNGFKGNPNEFLKAPTKAHAKKLQDDKYAITENQAEALMKYRYANHIRDLIKSNQEFAKENGKINQKKVINWSGLPRQVREVLFDMAYNIGPRFLTRKKDPFKDLRQSILNYQANPTRENVEQMVVDIRESKYYREQVGNRASANMQTLLDLIN